MTNKTKETDLDKIDLEAARQLVEREDAAKKDGVAPEKVDAGSGILMRPDPNDQSVRTYNPVDVEYVDEATKKPSKNSGQPVHDRS